MESFDRSFRFVDTNLQGKLVALLGSSGVGHAIDGDGTIRIAAADMEMVENELICSIRNQVFSKWNVFTLEGDGTRRPILADRYRRYMIENRIPFFEELDDGVLWFLIPDEYDSFDWGISDNEDTEQDRAPGCHPCD